MTLTFAFDGVAVKWNFEDGKNGWGQSTPLEMGVEVDAINGNLEGIIIPGRTTLSNAYVDSPELHVEVDADERDYLVFRMKYHGQCKTAMVSLERNPQETVVDPGIRGEGVIFHDHVDIPFQLQTHSLEYDIYYLSIWKHITGTIHRVRFHPCILLPKSLGGQDAQSSGQTFQIDWIAFAKAPVVTKIRGCIDKYFDARQSVASMNCTEHERLTNGYHRSSAFECFPMTLPRASTYNCVREGGERISISGKHFGESDAIITIDGIECLDVVHVIPEVELQCTLPPAAPAWLTHPSYPSLVRVHNGQLQQLFDEVRLLSYAAPVSSRPTPTISNVAAHAFDVNWIAPADIWESMTVTGYRISWKRCSEADFSPGNSIVVGNVTSTTIIGLERNTSYQVRIAALTEDQRQQREWQDIDLYGRRAPIANAVVGYNSPPSICITTLVTDIHFPRFEAHLVTNQSALTPSLTNPTFGPTGEIGDQGHFGLFMNGDANIQNANASISCCDGYSFTAGDPTVATAACTYVCSVVEIKSGVYINSTTHRTVPTNAPSAIPFPAKICYNSSLSSEPNAFQTSKTAPVSASCGPALRLTASNSFLTGSAWYPRQMNVHEGFQTTFTFQIANPSAICKFMDDVHTNCRSRGGEGFAFVVQNHHDLALGTGRMELGYGGLTNALAIEFDTWYNPEQQDVYENHVSVHVSGKDSPVQANHKYSLGSTSNVADLADGVHTIRITYAPNLDDSIDYFTASTLVGYFFSSGHWNSGIGILSVYFDDMETPILAVPIRLESAIELNHGRAWVGFTASTGETAWQTHDILSWSFRSFRKNIVTTPAAIY